MWAFYGDLRAKEDHLIEPTHLGTIILSGCPISPRPVARIRTRVIGDLWATSAHVLCIVNKEILLGEHDFSVMYPLKLTVMREQSI